MRTPRILRMGLALSAVLMVPRPAAAAADVPFGTMRLITGAAPGVQYLLPLDLDGDGDVDLVSAATAIVWYENLDGLGTFGPARAVSTSGAAHLTTADLDRDGDLDLLSADPAVSWHENRLNESSADFAPAVVLAAMGSRVVAGDLDRDGDADVVAASVAPSGELWWHVNTDGAGTFTAKLPLAWTPDPYLGPALQLADRDGDGDLDLIGSVYIAFPLMSSLFYVDNDGAASFGNPRYFGDGYSDVLALDFDLDGRMNVFALGPPNGDGRLFDEEGASLGAIRGQIPVRLSGEAYFDTLGAEGTLEWNFLGSGLGHPISQPGDGLAVAAAPADFDGDGDVDVSAAFDDDTIGWYENRSVHRNTAHLSEEILSGVQGEPLPLSVFAERIRGNDLHPDVVSASTGDERISVYQGSVRTVVSEGVTDGLSSVFASDLDRDGDLDVLSASWRDDTIAWYENLDRGYQFGPQQVISSTAVGAGSVSAADVDRDGDPDVLARSATSVVWYPNSDGAGAFGAGQAIVTGLGGVSDVVAADLDDDGDLDVLVASTDDDTVAWYENTDGAGGFGSAHVLSTTVDYAIAVLAADLDRDGDLDVIAGAANGGEISWAENRLHEPSADFGPFQLIGSEMTGDFQCLADVAAIDLDGDADVEVLLAAGCDVARISFYENVAGDGSAWVFHVGAAEGSQASSITAALDEADQRVVLYGARYNDGVITRYVDQGGQFTFTTVDLGPVAILNGETDDVLRITLAHNGRVGDANIEMATLHLHLESASGRVLSTSEANALVETLFVYRDEGDGSFGAGDALVQAVSFLPSGDFKVNFVTADPNVQVAPLQSATFFVVVTFTTDAQSQIPNTLRITHRTQTSSTVRDVDSGIELTGELAADTASRVILAASPSSDADNDGFLDIHETDTGIFVSATDTGTDPLDSDSDDDGLGDGVEVGVYGTDPLAPDTDGDGFSDGDEVAAGSSPLHASSTPGPAVLVAYYPFSGNADDASGSGLHGVVTGASLAPDRFGTLDSAYHFDPAGGLDFIDLGVQSAFDFSHGFTISAWVRPEASNWEWQTVVARWTGNGSLESFFLGTHTLPALAVFGEVTTVDSGNIESQSAPSSLEIDTWQHIAVAYDGVAGTLDTYRNGVRTSSTAAFGEVVSGPYPTTIGAIARSTLRSPFTGAIDEVCIYRRRVDDAYVSSLMNGCPATLPAAGPVLVPTAGPALRALLAVLLAGLGAMAAAARPAPARSRNRGQLPARAGRVE